MTFKGYRYPKDLFLLSVRWYLRYCLSYRDLEEILAERGLGPDHTTVYRWVRKFTPELIKTFNRRKMPVGERGRLDETYIKICGQWSYLYRAVDKRGQTVDFLLTAHRNRPAALRFLQKASGQNGVPTLINIDKSGANTAGIAKYKKAQSAGKAPVEVRQCKYLNNIVEQDHRFIKKRTRAMLGFQTFNSARAVLAGIEVVHMIRKGQLAPSGLGALKTTAEQFYQLAAQLRESSGNASFENCRTRQNLKSSTVPSTARAPAARTAAGTTG